MIPLFQQRAEIMCDNLDRFITNNQEGASKSLDMQTEFQKLTFDVIGLVALGMDFQSQKQQSNPYENAWEVVLKHLMFRFYCPLPKVAWQWLGFLPNVKRFNDSFGLLSSTVRECIALRRQDMKENDFPSEATDLLSLMITHQPGQDLLEYSDLKIQRELLTFMFAGHDTTRSTLCWLLVSQNVTLGILLTQPTSVLHNCRPIHRGESLRGN